MGYAVFPLSVVFVAAALIKARKNAQMGMFVETGLIPTLFCLMSFLLAWLGGVLSFSSIYLISATISAFMSFYIAIKGLPWRLPNNEKPMALASESIKMVAISLLSYALAWLPLILLSFWGAAEDVAKYSNCIRIGALISLTLAIANAIIAPKLAILHSKNDSEKIQRILNTTSKLMLLASLPCFLFIVATSEQLLSLFGEQYVSAQSSLFIISLGQLVNALFGPVNYLLIMSNNGSALVKANLITMLFLITFGSLLVKLGGLEGAAVASMSALILSNITAAFYCRKKLGVIPFRSGLKNIK
jgi:O-antigen/teichoic acid export membrane protein